MSSAEKGRVTIEEGVVFARAGGRDLKCDVYTPPGRPGNAPGVLLIHGGSWRNGDRTQLRGYGVLIGREGYVCVCPEYRLTDEAKWPAQIQDTKSALRWMRANSSSLGIDPERIAVQGNSAGGHLALLIAGTPGLATFDNEGDDVTVSTGVAAVLAIYPPTDLSSLVLPELMEEFLGHGGSAEDVRAASPITHVSADFPPTLLIHGTADETVDHSQSVRMFEALEQAGVPVELHLYAEQGHAFDAVEKFGRQCAAVMELFLSRYVREPAKAAVP